MARGHTVALGGKLAFSLLAAGFMLSCGGATDTAPAEGKSQSGESAEADRPGASEPDAKRERRKHRHDRKRHGPPRSDCDGGAAPAAIVAHAELALVSCAGGLSFEVFDVRTSEGQPISYLDYECSWTFDDGETSEACAGTHAFGLAGPHTATVRVRQRSTGGQVVVTTPPAQVYDPLQVIVEAHAEGCGLRFEYSAKRTGGRGSGFLAGSITPWETVLTPGPYPASGVIEVSAPGTYTLQFETEDEHPVGPICTAKGSAEVTLVACPAPDGCADAGSAAATR